jgi:hypothetical protein
MPVPGNSQIALLAYWEGNPTGVLMSELNIPFGTVVFDYTTPAIWQKTSTTDNSAFDLLSIGGESPTLTALTVTGLSTLGGGATVTGNISATGSILSSSPTMGVGYKTGAGGAVTQITSKATGVTLNTATGQITMNNANLTTVTAVHFTLTNSAIGANDTVVVNHSSAGTDGAYLVGVSKVAAGSADINVFNATAGTLGEAIVLSFAVVKGAVS